MSLRCCNNLLSLPGSHFQAACDAEMLLSAFKSSAASSAEGIRNEWALFVRNLSAVLFRTGSRETDAHARVVSCADAAMDIIRSAPPTAGMAVWNAVLALGTCAHVSPKIRSHIAAAGAQVSSCAVLHSLSFVFGPHFNCRKLSHASSVHLLLRTLPTLWLLRLWSCSSDVEQVQIQSLNKSRVIAASVIHFT